MKALNLIEESNEILQLADSHPGVRLVGQSKEEARRLLNNVKACRMEFRELRIPDDDEVLTTLINARRDLLRVLTESDNIEYANGTRAAAAAPAQSSPPPPSQPAREPETGLRYMLAMRQLDCEIGRLRSPRLIDIAPGADVKPDILKDLLKVDVPDVRKSVDRARDALKTLTAVATVADTEKLLDAQDACEQAISWTAMVEERCKAEQLHHGGGTMQGRTAAPGCQAGTSGGGLRALPPGKRDQHLRVLPALRGLGPRPNVSRLQG